MEEKAQQNAHDEFILKVLQLLDKGSFNDAKAMWLQDVLHLSPESIKENINHSEDEYGFSGYKHWFPVEKYTRCSNNKCPAHDNLFFQTDNSSLLDLRPLSIGHFLLMANKAFSAGNKCLECFQDYEYTLSFKFGDVPFLVYPINDDGSLQSRESRMRFTQVIKGIKYEVFAYTVLQNAQNIGAHYYVKFVKNYKKFVFDGLDSKSKMETENAENIVTRVWLLKA